MKKFFWAVLLVVALFVVFGDSGDNNNAFASPEMQEYIANMDQQ